MSTLYLPETLLQHPRLDKMTYCYGWKGKESLFVVGFLEGNDEEVMQRIKAVDKSMEMTLEILGTIDGGSVSTQITEETPQDNLFELVVSPNASPRLSSLGSLDAEPTIIIHSPPRLNEMISIHPLPLNLSNHRQDSTLPTSNITITRPRRLPGAPPRRKLRTDDVVGEELDQAIEWVRRNIMTSSRGSSKATPVKHRASPSDIPSLESSEKLPSYRYAFFGRLGQWSAAARQIATRLELLHAMPQNYSRSRSLPSETSQDSNKLLQANASYIRFWNAVWLLANDLIIGYALSSFVMENTQYLSRVIETLVQTYISGYLRELLDWLNNWPGGVKLNTELSTLICDSFLFLSRLWQDFFLAPFLPRLPSLLQFLSITGYLGGASLLLAFSSDLVQLLTFPFFACYVAATLVYRWSLVGLSALFDVFRGKKFNPLRNRTEPANYSVDALLLGTILFVTLIFLFPTIAAFYLAFASSRLTIVAIQTILGITIQAINAFPLFAVMLRMKSPGRLPGGVQLRMCNDLRHWKRDHWHLESRPLAFGAILSELIDLAKAFFSPQTLLNLLTKICT
ncbi:hypothetical protein JCM5353_003437, partial [Sporobolomyces roseus]